MDATAVPDSYPVEREHDEEDPEKESRIAARRKRIMQKIEADRRAAMGEKVEEVSYNLCRAQQFIYAKNALFN